MDQRVKAIRNDTVVGYGSCTAIDETFEDSELIEALDRKGISSPEKAVAWAREFEQLRDEYITDIREM